MITLSSNFPRCQPYTHTITAAGSKTGKPQINWKTICIPAASPRARSFCQHRYKPGSRREKVLIPHRLAGRSLLGKPRLCWFPHRSIYRSARPDGSETEYANPAGQMSYPIIINLSCWPYGSIYVLFLCRIYVNPLRIKIIY